jgi:predicted phage terminase large subunit-like protein
VRTRRQEAAEEYRDRKRARVSLEAFTRYTYPRYTADPFHSLLAEALDRVVSGGLTRLMVFAPPQHGKSELVSVRLPAYWLARRPDDPVILASYGADLADDKARQARQIVESDAFANLFPAVTTRKDSRAVAMWHLNGSRGYMRAVGVGGPIMGHGARLGIIDDPFENWQQAQSPTIRNKVWDWWRGTFRTRIWEGGSVILVMSRWHQDDLAGRLLKEQGNEWTVLRLDAVCETQSERDLSNRQLGLSPGLPDPLGRAPGAPLSPSRYSAEALAGIRRDVGSLVWAAQYKGVPSTPEGNHYKRSWFKRFRNLGDAYQICEGGELFLKRECVHFLICDPAAAGKPTSDATAVLRFALTPALRPGHAPTVPRLLVVMAHREKLRFEEIAPRLLAIWREDKSAAWVGIEVESVFDAIAREALRLGVPVRRLKAEGKSKFVRAMPSFARCEAGQVLLPEYGAWVEPLLDELAAFTGLDGGQDDQVDCLAYGAQLLTDEACNPSFRPYVAGSTSGVPYQ